MSHRDTCPDPRDAHREGERAQERGYGSFRNPYDGYGEDRCDEAAREWRSGWYAAERREEEQREQEAAKRRLQAHREEARAEEDYYYAQQQEDYGQAQEYYAELGSAPDTSSSSTASGAAGSPGGRIAPAWQPIETAPKDQTRVLLCGPESIDIGMWQEEQPDVVESGTLVEAGMDAGWFGSEGMWPGGEQPTHWMPLPDPPAVPVSASPSLPEVVEKNDDAR